jgi:hypothetical protein
MPGQGELAKSSEINVNDDDTIENKELLDDIAVVTVEDSNKGKANEAAQTTKSTDIKDSGMEPQETVVTRTAPLPAPVPSRMESKEPLKVVQPPAPKKVVQPPAPKKVVRPPAQRNPNAPMTRALQKSQDLMHGFDVASTSTGMCVGYFKVEGTDAHVLAACAKTPENTCPVTFDTDTCTALKPVNVDVTQGAKVMMF